MLINTYPAGSFLFYLQRNIAKRYVKVDKQIITICHTANNVYVKVIQACHTTVFVSSQLTCVSTYIKYVTEKSHKKIVNYVKSTLASIVGAKEFTEL